MRKPIIAGNWKMNKTREEALAFAEAVAGKLPSVDKAEAVICAPATFLYPLAEAVAADVLEVGAQTMNYVESGAYTGEVSPAMVLDAGAKYVVIGHSERRAYYNETDETVNLKALKALEVGLTPIVCCGEELEVREAGTTDEIVSAQVEKAFAGITAEDAVKVVVAYEPIWAIGTGRTATAEQANETCGTCRAVIEKLYGSEVAEAVRIQYGGSVKPANVQELMDMPHIDGALVGGASLDPESFVALFTPVK